HRVESGSRKDGSGGKIPSGSFLPGQRADGQAPASSRTEGGPSAVGRTLPQEILEIPEPASLRVERAGDAPFVAPPLAGEYPGAGRSSPDRAPLRQGKADRAGALEPRRSDGVRSSGRGKGKSGRGFRGTPDDPRRSQDLSFE